VAVSLCLAQPAVSPPPYAVEHGADVVTSRSRRAPRAHIAVEGEIARRIALGEDPDDFLCFDCWCWMLEPALCGCWERPVFESTRERTRVDRT
jgi:hypothetical protein